MQDIEIKRSIKMLACGFAAIWPSLSIATEVAPTQSPADLRTMVQDFLEQEVAPQQQTDGSRRVEIEVGHIDPRLRLPGCEQEPTIGLNGRNRTTGKVQVKVQCSGSQAWSKYVAAEIRVFESVLVANHNLARGTLLDASHLSFQELDIGQLRRTPIFSEDRVIGKELKYSLTAGAPVALEVLQLPKVVQRGDMVQLLAETEFLTVRQQAEALEAGEVGKVIDVRNTSSRLVVQAVVVAAGKVKIQL